MLLKGALRGGVQRDTLGVKSGLREVKEGLKEASGGLEGVEGILRGANWPINDQMMSNSGKSPANKCN